MSVKVSLGCLSAVTIPGPNLRLFCTPLGETACISPRWTEIANYEHILETRRPLNVIRSEKAMVNILTDTRCESR
ncbi:hypothetical protein FA13DRAFT_1727959 [Coprinellus micaceus]|uniref:Uncharacterized protein n=1 Tax=Coprinellus micaceus TaxID=71717 RepID=A0A4Y7TR48_COPMI|nr:hypothetical protein FA13DRAFT_1727959 [Coprinellus micaceus]